MDGLEWAVGGAIAVPGVVLLVYRAGSKARRRRAIRDTIATVRARNGGRRMQGLERRMGASFDTLRAYYGDLFYDYRVVRRGDAYRMDVSTGTAWRAIDAFSKSMIVRFLFRQLSALVAGTVEVVVDAASAAAIVWTWATDVHFDDQDRREPWLPEPARVGTMLSFGAPGAAR